MNCVDMNCKYCKARKIYTHSSVLPDWIMGIYCEKGRTVHTPFGDNGEPVYCDFYEKRKKEENHD